MPSCVLAYSGGLDTSVILGWLQDEGYDVHCVYVDLGQPCEDRAAIDEKARTNGAASSRIVDVREELCRDFAFPVLQWQAKYEGIYLLGTSIARPLISKVCLDVAREVGADAYAHGATGKGNDQVRFELAFAALAPRLRVIAPWKEHDFLKRFQGRSDLLSFARTHQIPVEATVEKPFSSDENLMHRSYEAGILEDPGTVPPENMFKLTRSPKEAPDTPVQLSIQFKDAVPVRVDNLSEDAVQSDPVRLLEYLNAVGGTHGVGRVDMVENRFVGIKSRGVYETPGGTILHHALRDLEGMAMDREVLRLRDMLSPRFAELIYNGLWFSPEMDFIQAAFRQSEKLIDGKVIVELYKGSVSSVSRESTTSLYD